MPTYDFKSAIKRVFEAAECRTQIELAKFLGVRQSSISDAKRRKSIPDNWLVKLLKKKQINPEWTLYGKGAKFLVPADLTYNEPHVVRVTVIRPPAECSAQELINELVRRALNKPAVEKGQEGSAKPINTQGDESE